MGVSTNGAYYLLCNDASAVHTGDAMMEQAREICGDGEAYAEEKDRERLFDVARGVWTSRNMTRTQVEDMTNEHMSNTLAMLERRKWKSLLAELWIERFKSEERRREASKEPA